ncbi:MAG: bifunctional nuclease family protein [Planctomycetota bacterium]|nr:bifunctional nuclease family protein [Planctomycetota bacterium]
MEKLIESEISRLVIDQTSDSQMVFLREKNAAARCFPIIIGTIEALALHRALNNEKPERPMTHELILHILNGLNARVSKVIITDLRGNTFYALISIDIEGKCLEIDSRPSDALTLAAHYNAPIFVSDKVFRSVTT